MKKTVFITGATSGIGRATAILFAEKGYKLVICGRRADRLQALQEHLLPITEVHTLCFDISKRAQVADAIAAIPEPFQKIHILINNAGNAHGLASIDKGNVDDWDEMININVKGLLYITRAIVPYMVEVQRGHIINIGSIAGKEVYTNGNVYNASKFAVDALGKGMLLDLNPYGIRVSNINPGLVATEFSLVRFKGDEARAEAIYKGYEPLTAEDVAETIYWVAERPAHVNISDLTILPTAQASATTVKKHFP
jgi:3-hydroxy acid dehydrogenase / malonic semialdehyde reductase